MDSTIKTLIKLLNIKGRKDLSDLLIRSKTEILQSSQFGSHQHSILSTILINSPPEDYIKMKELPKIEHDQILKLIQEIYPPTDNKPEIVDMGFRILTEDVTEPEVEKTEGGFIDKSIRLFISYASKTEAVVAGKIKELLERYFGIDVFLAHEDIEGAIEWEKEIIENLNRTDIFLPLLSRGFMESPYADQEVGAACAKHKLIVPVSIGGVTPYGFIRKLQAIKFHIDPSTAFLSQWLLFCEEVVSAIERDKRYAQSVRNSLIRAFEASWSFKMSQTFVPIIEKHEPYDIKQVNNIVSAITKNTQINGEAYIVPQFVKSFVKKHRKEIDPKLLAEVFDTPIFEREE